MKFENSAAALYNGLWYSCATKLVADFDMFCNYAYDLSIVSYFDYL